MKPTTFGERLRFAQEQSGLSMTQLARRTHVELGLLQTGGEPVSARCLTLEQLASLCQTLRCSWAWLVEGTPTRNGREAAERMRNTLATWPNLSDDERDLCCQVLEMLP